MLQINRRKRRKVIGGRQVVAFEQITWNLRYFFVTRASAAPSTASVLRFGVKSAIFHDHTKVSQVSSGACVSPAATSFRALGTHSHRPC